MTLLEFKKTFNIDKLIVQKGKGRMFADLPIAGNPQRAFFSKTADLTKDLYVNKGAHGVFWIGNNTTEIVATV